MGVPGFFRDLSKTYPHIIKNSIGSNISHFYIDANCFFHPQCFKVLALNINETDQDILFEKMCDRIIKFLIYLEEFINPSDVFYIAVDGTAPLAKINQQRQRRFGYANDYKNVINNKYNIPHNSSWSNIVITPGTPFMYKLHIKLEKHFKSRIKLAGSETTHKIIYSSYLTPGEGEHKILQHIKTNISKNLNSPIVIYGLDADLIFLAMASQYNNLYLLREADQFNQTKVDHDDPDNVGEELMFVDIDLTKESINIQLNGEYNRFIDTEYKFESTKLNNTSKTNFKFDFCNDYIFICYFLGNDFLPHLPSVDIKMSGMSIVIDSYMSVVESRSTTMVKYDKNNKVVIDSEFLCDFISSLAAKEDHFFQSILPDNLHKLRRRRCYEVEHNKRDTWNVENLRSQIDLKGNLTNLIVKDPVKLGVGKPADWKYRYYEHYFHANLRQNELIDKLCENYVEGLFWVAKYYFEDCPTWRWQYRYSHAPFLSDIMLYLEKADFRNCDNLDYFDFLKEPPLDMYTQLTSVIPHKYSHILPHELKKLSSKADSPVIDMFPMTYPIDMINKTMLYKCVPHIPFLDVSRIENVVLKCKLSKDEIIRSTCRSEYVFDRITKTKKIYKNKSYK